MLARRHGTVRYDTSYLHTYIHMHTAFISARLPLHVTVPLSPQMFPEMAVSSSWNRCPRSYTQALSNLRRALNVFRAIALRSNTSSCPLGRRCLFGTAEEHVARGDEAVSLGLLEDLHRFDDNQQPRPLSTQESGKGKGKERGKGQGQEAPYVKIWKQTEDDTLECLTSAVPVEGHASSIEKTEEEKGREGEGERNINGASLLATPPLVSLVDSLPTTTYNRALLVDEEHETDSLNDSLSPVGNAPDLVPVVEDFIATVTTNGANGGGGGVSLLAGL